MGKLKKIKKIFKKTIVKLNLTSLRNVLLACELFVLVAVILLRDVNIVTIIMIVNMIINENGKTTRLIRSKEPIVFCQ